MVTRVQESANSLVLGPARHKGLALLLLFIAAILSMVMAAFILYGYRAPISFRIGVPSMAFMAVVAVLILLKDLFFAQERLLKSGDGIRYERQSTISKSLNFPKNSTVEILRSPAVIFNNLDYTFMGYGTWVIKVNDGSRSATIFRGIDKDTAEKVVKFFKT